MVAAPHGLQRLRRQAAHRCGRAAPLPISRIARRWGSPRRSCRTASGLASSPMRCAAATPGTRSAPVDRRVLACSFPSVAAVPLVDQRPDMVVAVDESWHHRLSRGSTRRAGRRLTLAAPADPRDGVALHEKRRVLDRRARRLIDDEPRSSNSVVLPCHFERGLRAKTTATIRQPGRQDSAAYDPPGDLAVLEGRAAK